MGKRLSAIIFHQNRRIMHRSSLLSIHGHALSGQRTLEKSQIQDQSGARVYTEFQNSSRWFQKDECG